METLISLQITTENASSRPHRRALVVDREPLIMELLHEFLSEFYDVTSVTTGTEALAELRNRRFDVALVDYHLPDRGALHIARAAFETALPVVWMTGDPEGVKIPSGQQTVLAKPFAMHRVLGALAGASAN